MKYQTLCVALLVIALAPSPGAAAITPFFEPGSLRVDPYIWALPPGSTVHLAIPDGPAYKVVVQGRRYSPSGNPTWRGHIVDAASDAYWVTLTGGPESGLYGTMLTPHGEYSVSPADSVWNEVALTLVTTPVNATLLDTVPYGPGQRLPARDAETSTKSTPTSDAMPTVLGVMVLYTANTRGDRSDAQWEAYLDDLFAVTNEAYERSGTLIELQRVDTRLVDASETLTSVHMLDQLSPTRGGFDTDAFGEVEVWRLSTQAHFVTLLREFRPEHFNCGQAHVPACGDDADCYNAYLGYSVVSIGSCTKLMLAHEIAHNLGSAHEPGDFVGGTYPYSHGHVVDAGAVATIMSVNHGYSLIGLFSSPELDCNGHPCGIAEISDNARSLRNTRLYIERWFTDRSITLLAPPVTIGRGVAVPLNFLWFGVLGERFDIDLYRHGSRVAALAVAEHLPMGFKMVAIPGDLELGGGYTFRITSSAVPTVSTESEPMELVDAGPPGEFAFTTATVTATAGATSVTLTVTRSNGSAGQVLVDFVTSDGTAVAGTHYTATSGSLAWTDGDTGESTITVPIRAITGQNRTFTVALVNPSAGATLGTPAAVAVTITATPGSRRGGGGAFSVLGLTLLVLLVTFRRFLIE
jgi:hypothetical protein